MGIFSCYFVSSIMIFAKLPKIISFLSQKMLKLESPASTDTLTTRKRNAPTTRQPASTAPRQPVSGAPRQPEGFSPLASLAIFR